MTKYVVSREAQPVCCYVVPPVPPRLGSHSSLVFRNLKHTPILPHPAQPPSPNEKRTVSRAFAEYTSLADSGVYFSLFLDREYTFRCGLRSIRLAFPRSRVYFSMRSTAGIKSILLFFLETTFPLDVFWPDAVERLETREKYTFERRLLVRFLLQRGEPSFGVYFFARRHAVHSTSTRRRRTMRGWTSLPNALLAWNRFVPSP